jgi:hypothetical protein
MKLARHFSSLVFAGLLPLTAVVASAHDGHDHDKKDAKQAPKSDYPLDVCVVSDDKLDHEGKPVEFIYKQAGKPDRKILLCCEGCIDDFKKEPETYLAKLDAAYAEKTKAAAKQEKK